MLVHQFSQPCIPLFSTKDSHASGSHRPFGSALSLGPRPCARLVIPYEEHFAKRRGSTDATVLLMLICMTYGVLASLESMSDPLPAGRASPRWACTDISRAYVPPCEPSDKTASAYLMRGCNHETLTKQRPKDSSRARTSALLDQSALKLQPACACKGLAYLALFSSRSYR